MVPFSTKYGGCDHVGLPLDIVLRQLYAGTVLTVGLYSPNICFKIVLTSPYSDCLLPLYGLLESSFVCVLRKKIREVNA